jgi:hypothetical protein
MSSLARIAIVAAVGLTMIATLYVYWTRTPQYTLLDVLNAYSHADPEGVTATIEKQPPLKSRLRVNGTRENVVQYLARLQNTTLERVYRITVEESRIDGTVATLRVKVDQTAYQLTFRQQMDGRWKLIDFENREQFATQALQHMKDHPFFLLARL